MKCSMLLKIIEEYASKKLALEYDNVGMLVGETEKEINKILVALDLTDDVADEAVELGADIIITHHPIIFNPIKKITDETAQGRRIIKLIRHGISAYAAHTNLDMASGGTNDVLFELLGLMEKENLCKPDLEGNALGRAGRLVQPMTFREFANAVKEKLRLDAVNISGPPEKAVSKIGLCTGSSANAKYMLAAKECGCDVYITGDVGHHGAQSAVELDIALIDATHYATEVLIVDKLCEYLRKNTKGPEIYKTSKDTRFFYTIF